jgi:signal peptidase I
MIAEAHLQSACCDLVADVARISGRVQLKVTGASMVPALWPGDFITVRSFEPSQLRPDSIIVFRQKERLIVHRLMHRSGVNLITRGDARPLLDAPVSVDEVIGQVESISRNGRPVGFYRPLWHRVIAWLMRRSERFAQLFLRVGSWLRRTVFRGSAPVEATLVY